MPKCKEYVIIRLDIFFLILSLAFWGHWDRILINFFWKFSVASEKLSANIETDILYISQTIQRFPNFHYQCAFYFGSQLIGFHMIDNPRIIWNLAISSDLTFAIVCSNFHPINFVRCQIIQLQWSHFRIQCKVTPQIWGIETSNYDLEIKHSY